MANDPTVEVIITAKDRATNTIKGIGDSLGKAFKTGGFIAAAGLGAFAGALGLVIKEGMEGEKVQAQLNAVIESTGGVAGWSAKEANILANSLSRVTTFSADTIIAGESLLLTFTNIGEDVMPMATETMLDMATAMGTDLKGVSIQLGKALNDPIAGVSALAEVGVTFTEEQKKMIESMVEAGDMAGAQTLILEELGREFGGSARAAGDTFAGKLIILKNKFMDVVETVGMALIPVLSGFADILLSELIPAFDRFLISDFMLNLSENAGRLANSLAGVVKTIVPFVKKHSKAFVAAIAAMGAVITAVAVIGGIMSIGAALVALINPLTLIVAAVGLLAFAWQEDFLGIRTVFMEQVWPPLQEAFAEFIAIASNLWQEFKKYIPLIEAVLAQIWTTVEPILKEFIAMLGEYLPKALKMFVDLWSLQIDIVLAIFRQLWDNVLKPIFGSIVDYLMTNIPLAIDTFKTGWDKIKNAFETLSNFWNNVLKPAFENLVNWFEETLPVAVDVAKTVLEDTFKNVLQKIRDFVFDTLMPALWQVDDWLAIALGIAVDVAKTVFDKLKTAIQNTVDFLSTVLEPILQRVYDFFETFIPAAIETVKTGFGIFVEKVQEVVEFLAAKFEPILQKVYDFFEAYMPGAIDTMKTALALYIEKVLEVATFLQEQFEPILQKVYDFFETFIPGAIDKTKEGINTLRTRFIAIRNYVVNFLEPAFNKITDWFDSFKQLWDSVYGAILDGMKSKFEDIENFVSGLSSAFNGVVSGLQSLVQPLLDLGSAIADATSIVPDWIIPGSPTPFELGIRGIASSIQEFNRELASLELTLESSGLRNTSVGRESTNNFNLTINSNADSENLRTDFELMRVWGDV